jgi:5'-methylthioadenosine phosphorylase
VLAFESLVITQVVGLNSVGALDPLLAPGEVVVADDYLSVHPPPTFAEDERLHIVPALDEDLRALLVAAANETEGEVRPHGTYVETRGPRFETRAEIRMLMNFGEVIGMTAASEATLFQERGIAYAMLGLVDNYANGIGAEPLTFDDYESQREKNEKRARAILDSLIRHHRARGAEEGAS